MSPGTRSSFFPALSQRTLRRYPASPQGRFRPHSFCGLAILLRIAHNYPLLSVFSRIRLQWRSKSPLYPVSCNLAWVSRTPHLHTYPTFGLRITFPFVQQHSYSSCLLEYTYSHNTPPPLPGQHSVNKGHSHAGAQGRNLGGKNPRTPTRQWCDVDEMVVD